MQTRRGESADFLQEFTDKARLNFLLKAEG